MADENLNSNAETVETGGRATTEGQPVENKSSIDIESLNTFLEIPEDKRFKSADEFKSTYSDMHGRYDQYKDVERVKKELGEKQSEYETHMKEVEALYQEANPEKIFGSKEAYKNYLIRQQITQDGSKDAGVVDTILNNDISKFDELELIFYNKMMNIPGLDMNEAIGDIIFNDLRKSEDDFVDEDGNKIPLDKINKAELFKILKPHEVGKLKAMAANAKKELLSIKNTDVQADNNYFTSFQAKRDAEKKAKEDKINSLKESWKPVYDSFKDIKSVQLTEKDKEGNEQVIFDFPIDSGVLSKMDKIAEEYVVFHNIERTDENIQKVKDDLIDGYASKNWRKLVTAALTQSAQREVEKNISERENRQPMNTRLNTEQPTTDVAKINDERLRKAGFI